MRPLQNQVTDMAVFGLSVAFLGFVTKMVREMAVSALGGDKSPSLLPATTTEKNYRELAEETIDSIQNAVDEERKTDSIRRIERILKKAGDDTLKFILGLKEFNEAIHEYRSITREGLTPEEYLEEKDTAFQNIIDSAQELDLDEEALEELEEGKPEEPRVPPKPPREPSRPPVEILDRLIKDKVHDTWPPPSMSEARKMVYKDILEAFRGLQEADEYIAGMPEDKVIFTARGDEIPFSLIRLVIADIRANAWLSPFAPEPPLHVPEKSDDIRSIRDKYGLWATRQAEALCPRNDVACIEREARRLTEVVKYRRSGQW